MKRTRTPPKKWRRNMIAAVVFLAILDAIIISATPNMTRIGFAILVTIVVGFMVAKIWRSNTEFERAATRVQ
jgi:hypothetical protein